MAGTVPHHLQTGTPQRWPDSRAWRAGNEDEAREDLKPPLRETQTVTSRMSVERRNKWSKGGCDGRRVRGSNIASPSLRDIAKSGAGSMRACGPTVSPAVTVGPVSQLRSAKMRRHPEHDTAAAYPSGSGLGAYVRRRRRVCAAVSGGSRKTATLLSEG